MKGFINNKVEPYKYLIMNLMNKIIFSRQFWIIIQLEDKIRDTIRPYKAKASPKIKIKIIPTKILSCWAFARTPASPTIPIANPAAKELNPQHNPDAK